MYVVTISAEKIVRIKPAGRPAEPVIVCWRDFTAGTRKVGIVAPASKYAITTEESAYLRPPVFSLRPIVLYPEYAAILTPIPGRHPASVIIRHPDGCSAYVPRDKVIRGACGVVLEFNPADYVLAAAYRAELPGGTIRNSGFDSVPHRDAAAYSDLVRNARQGGAR